MLGFVEFFSSKLILFIDAYQTPKATGIPVCQQQGALVNCYID